jgi:hypothetical protein
VGIFGEALMFSNSKFHIKRRCFKILSTIVSANTSPLGSADIL